MAGLLGEFQSMIAKVRIAPVERWCDNARKDEPLELCEKLVGLEVEIYAEQMTTNDKHEPGARTWRITDESRDRLFHAIDRIPLNIPWRLCEHMLEMD
jgi:hypothetical protein